MITETRLVNNYITHATGLFYFNVSWFIQNHGKYSTEEIYTLFIKII